MATKIDIITAAQFYIDKVVSDPTIGGTCLLYAFCTLSYDSV